MVNLRNNHNFGFTLIEVMVAISIFSIVVTIGIGSLITVNKAYDQSQVQRAVIDNTSFVLESMAREIRTGQQYTCGTNPAAASNAGSCGTSNKFSFVNFDGDEIWYRLNGTTIEKVINGDVFALTPENVAVEKLWFVIDETTSAGPKQPYVVIHITARGNDSGQSSSIVMQTSVSQRALNTLFNI